MTNTSFQTGDIVRSILTGRKHRVCDAYGCAVWIEGGRSIHPSNLVLVSTR